MERDVLTMSGVAMLALGALVWCQLTVAGGPTVRVAGIASLLVVLFILVVAVRSALLRVRRTGVRLGDDVAEQLANFATSCEDVDELLPPEAGRLRPATVARTGATLAAANEAVKTWIAVSARPMRLADSGRRAARLLLDPEGVGRRMLDEVRIDRATH